MNKSNLWILLSLLLSVNVTYAACYQIDDAGRKWVTLNTTAKTIGTVSKVKKCADIVYATPPQQVCEPVPIQNKLCAESAKLMFDSKYQGMRIYVNRLPNESERCLFIKPTATPDGVQVSMYDATRVIDGVEMCGQ